MEKRKRRWKILEIDSCEDCMHFEEYEQGSARCTEKERYIKSVEIPWWCPLENAERNHNPKPDYIMLSRLKVAARVWRKTWGEYVRTVEGHYQENTQGGAKIPNADWLRRKSTGQRTRRETRTRRKASEGSLKTS